MAELTVAGLFVTPIVETLVKGLIDFLKDETVSILNVKKELEGMERKLQKIMFIVKDAEKQSLHDEGIRLRMTDLKDIAYDIDDIIDDCKVKAQGCASTSCLKNLKFSCKIGKRVKEINAKLEKIDKENKHIHFIEPIIPRPPPSNNAKKTTQFAVDDAVGCVEEDAKKLMKKMCEKNESGGRTCINLAILGMGGIGKTTLAQKIFDIVTQSGQFQQKIWICVSKDFKVEDLLKEIVRKVDEKYLQGESQNDLEETVRRVVRDKKFFLVLDDVWNADIWEKVLKGPLNAAANGSKILITTRDVNIAKKMSAFNLHEVQLLSIAEGWVLLCNNVFITENERNNSGYLKDVGVKIVEKCGQLPLAIKTIAGILKTKEQRISEWEKIIFNEVWTQNIFEDDVMKALYLSYEDLSYQLKQCFVYCSLFPKGYTFVKGNLVQLWIAEGFLGDNVTLESGEDFHKELVNRNLLQQDRFSNHHKLHDLLRYLGQILSNGEHFYGNLKNLDKSVHKSVRRMSLQNENSLFGDYSQRVHKKLRTLMLFESSELKDVPSKSVFQKLQYLRVLSLSGTKIEVIPDSIKNLLHLRYLDLSFSKVRTISESIGYLKSLQFIRLYECEFLEKLPESITSLQNLMSLEYSTSNAVQMPKGVERLQQLQSLVFKVPENENLGSNIKVLQSLNLLKDLRILNLHKNLSLEEARSMKLLNKNHLRNLTLHWMYAKDVSDEDMNRVTEVFQELHPPPRLLYLFIYNFYGHNLPNWMSYSNGISLINLVQLEVKGCEHCQQIPGFGKLPQLEVLKISKASGIQKIGPEFLGRGDGSTSTYFRPFAKLEYLKLKDLSELEELHWDGQKDDDDGGTTPFPCLQRLYIKKCPKLKSLPVGLQHAMCFVKLVLDGNRDLERIPCLPTVKYLLITNCSSMQHVGNLNSLEHIELVDVKLDAIPSWLSWLVTGRSKELSSMSSFQKLCIGTGELQLLRRLCPWDIGLDWPLIKDIPQVQARLVGQDCKAGGTDWDFNNLDGITFVDYIKSPFSITAVLTNTGSIVYNDPHFLSNLYI